MTFGLVQNGGKRQGKAKLGSTRFSAPAKARRSGTSHEADRGGKATAANAFGGSKLESNATSLKNELELVKLKDEIDLKMGYSRFIEGERRLGWLANMTETLVTDPEWPSGRSAVDMYFIQEDGSTFKSTIVQSPYFLLGCRQKNLPDVEEYLRRRFDKTIERLSRMTKEDLDLPNHLLGHRNTFIRLDFRNTEDLNDVKRVLMPVIRVNQDRRSAEDAYADFANLQDDIAYEGASAKQGGFKDGLDYMTDIREFDVPFLSRLAIDHDYRVGLWYYVEEESGKINITRESGKVLWAEPVIFAFDIETSKAPLKFPDSNYDQIMMISYMVDGQGYLITNREIVSDDIIDFDYTPRPGEYDGPFMTFNENDEKSLLERFFEHIRELRPGVFVTYNGDFFDWPFIEVRSSFYDMDMYKEIGVMKNNSGEYFSSYASHIDCFCWVRRDSYLPVGSQGLKAVTKAKLGYDPKELDPELMTRYAAEQPQTLADYSVSDAVATYYLYMKYVHPFIFSLCNIIPLAPDDVLRKGSGTLCEMLLMVEAYKANVIMPNKHATVKGKLFEGHYLESETYVGGHVEALESGVFRSDIPTHFKLAPSALQQLLDDLDRALTFSIEVEEKKSKEDIINYEEVRNSIAEKLLELRDHPVRKENPLIYHLDVAAMYPNIILTNRLQPPALVNEEMCAACDFNKPGSDCQRRMQWSWRGEYFPADRSEFNMIKNQLESERFPSKDGTEFRTWNQMSINEQSTLIQKRLSDYCRKVYRKIHESKVLNKESIVCQRENSFYVDTVRNFRDRRYEYKGRLKDWKKNLEAAIRETDLAKTDEAKKMIVLMDSLQLAHKCILNSFYGYVMRKGSRWYSMEMAGIVCLTGANIITMARQLVEKIGRPLELDTDGIWCILPGSFPENFTFKLRNGKNMTISYPCSMLNHLVHDKFTNHQYQDLVDPDTHTYVIRAENSIFFEVDGPYRAMILPASKEEDKLLKKRYAVFNDDGSLAELKGFEVKRRGELKIIKIFQEEVFHEFLKGTTLTECYAAVAKVADRWLDILYSKGRTTSDEELLDYISENRNMSKALEEYGSQKSTSISTAKRLAEFLGDQMVKDKGLACKFIIAAKPSGSPVAERAIPIAIFSAETSVKKHYLRKWLKDNSLKNFDIRSILDWQYYLERLGSTIQKLVTIPAAMQSVTNPIPRILHPDWLVKRTAGVNGARQNLITDSFRPKDASIDVDIEDAFGSQSSSSINRGPVVHKITYQKKSAAPSVVASVPIPRFTEDYAGWLQHQKQKWKSLRVKKRVHGTFQREGKVDPKSSLSSYYGQQGRIAKRQNWEIIQVVETELAGEFKIWVLVDRMLYSVKLNVPRVFYVNCKQPDTIGTFFKVSKKLPRSHIPYNIYEFVLNEKDYQENSDIYKCFTWHHDTVGVYETKIPLMFRALMKLGCTVALDPHNIDLMKRGMDGHFVLGDFVNSGLVTQNYLTGNRLNYLFLYHSNSDTRHVFGLFIPHLKRGRIFLVDPYNGDQIPNTARLYKELFDKGVHPAPVGFDEIFTYDRETTLTTTRFTNELDAMKEVQRSLIDYRDESRGPAVVLVQSPRQLNSLCSHMRVLFEFPCAPITSMKKHNMYPALDWQKVATRRMLSSYLFARDWLIDRILLSRYCNVPIANIDQDTTLFLSDLFFARRLTAQDNILWYSPTENPDLGGREDDDNFFANDELRDPEFCLSGCYNTICIEYSLENLPMNTILQSTFINEIEGSDGYAGLTNSNMATIDEQFDKQKGDIDFTAVDENAPSFQAFRSLRDLVKSWAKEVHVHHNMFGDLMLKNFFRWISSRHSRLYEPSLYAHLHSLMKKVLMQLLAEFKRLGSKIVFANFNKIIVLTSKTSYQNAQTYDKFILKTIKNKELFLWIDLKPERFWDQLVWMDEVNYGGILCTEKLDQAIVSGIDENSDTEEQLLSQAPSLEMQWNISRYLPPFIQEYFSLIIAEFLLKIHEIKLHQRQGRQAGETPVRGIPRNVTASQMKNTDELVLDMRTLIREYFTRKMLDIIPEIQQTLSGVLETDEDLNAVSFPNLPGSHLKMDNAPLELIKFVCKVFSLVSDTEHEVRIMRRSLLKLIGVREFCPESEFTNPCESFTLPHVICSYCQHCRDIDLTREDDLTDHRDSQTSFWCCPHCFQEYDKATIEQALIEMVQRNLVAYQYQDLICTKCKEIKEENVREHCKACASPFGLASSKQRSVDSVKRKIKTVLDISARHKMHFLKESMTWISEQQSLLSVQS